ncbi:MAG TPA: hydroxylamine reductase, partial [Alphaproteobacteria bacterium]|nr:hydroxylamine reductase [Alphaproteobacteria bacterium]
NDLNQLYKGAMHANPGGWAYSEGWSPLVGCYARVMDADTRLREMASIRARLAAVEQKTGLAMLDLDSDFERASVGSLGGALMLVGVTGLLLRRRRSDTDDAR